MEKFDFERALSDEGMPTAAWHAQQRIPTSLGEFQIEVRMSEGDDAPPTDDEIRQADELAAFARSHGEALLDKVHHHYSCVGPEWLSICMVPSDLRRDQLASYLDYLAIVVERDYGPPFYFIAPRWDEEHAIYLVLEDGQLKFED